MDDNNTEIYPAEIETLIDAMKSIGGVSKFAVWDNNKYRKRFADLKNQQIILNLTNGGLKGLYGGDGYMKDWQLFQSVGIQDINGKEIIADSSIVEFEYDNLNGYYNSVKGFFYKDKWQYRLKVLWSETPMGVDNLPMAYQKTPDIKVIDSIQENKLGLIK